MIRMRAYCAHPLISHSYSALPCNYNTSNLMRVDKQTQRTIRSHHYMLSLSLSLSLLVWRNTDVLLANFLNEKATSEERFTYSNNLTVTF